MLIISDRPQVLVPGNQHLSELSVAPASDWSVGVRLAFSLASHGGSPRRVSAKDVPSPRHQMLPRLPQCSCVPTPRLAKITPSGFQVAMSQAIDIQLFLPASGIATQQDS